jgi:hypothetical protein
MFWLLTFLIIPIGAFLWARRYAHAKLWRITGVAVGAVVSPAAMGLYSLYFVGPLVALLGLLGLPLMLLHEAPGYWLAIEFRLVQPRTVVQGVPQVYIELLNGLFWSATYGLLGYLLDGRRSRPKARGGASPA